MVNPIAWTLHPMPYTKRKRSRSRRRPFKKSRRGKYSLKKTVNRIINRKLETKYFDQGDQNVQVYHNVGGAGPYVGSLPVSDTVFFNPWLDIPQGVGRAGRIGDEIMPVGMSLKIMLRNKLDRPNLYYRVIVCKLPKSTPSGPGFVISTKNNVPIFEDTNQGTVGCNMLRPINKDLGVRPYYDKLIRLQGNNTDNGGSKKEISKIIKIWIKRKRSSKIIYDNAAGAIINGPLALYVIPYDAFGTLATDNIGSYDYYCRMYYKDA